MKAQGQPVPPKQACEPSVWSCRAVLRVQLTKWDGGCTAPQPRGLPDPRRPQRWTLPLRPKPGSTPHRGPFLSCGDVCRACGKKSALFPGKRLRSLTSQNSTGDTNAAQLGPLFCSAPAAPGFAAASPAAPAALPPPQLSR